MSLMKRFEEEFRHIESEVASLKVSIESTRKVPRDGEPWSDFEREHLAERIDAIVEVLSMKYGRTQNALWWAILRIAQSKKL